MMIRKTAILLLAILCMGGLEAIGQPKSDEKGLHAAVRQKAGEIFDSLVQVRRDLHRHPEPSGQEERTAVKIAEYLRALGLSVATQVGGHGVVGTLQGGKKGKKIAWRADTDAVFSDAPDPESFRSENKGVRHICGHDVHTAIGLGIAHVLASQKEALAGTVYFVFQPSEENLAGAQAMVDDGLFDRVGPEEIYALHVSPFPVGTIAVKANEMFAASRGIKVTLKPSGGDTSAVAFVKSLLAGLHSVPQPEKFWDMDNMGDPEVGLASPTSIYQDYLVVSPKPRVVTANGQTTIYARAKASGMAKLDTALSMLRRGVAESKHAGAVVDVALVAHTPTVDNDAALTTQSVASIAGLYGPNSAIMLNGVIPDDRSDDFALFQQKVPGVYFFLGGSDYERGVIAMPHAPFFAVDERSIKIGVEFFSSMLIERLGGQ